MDKQAELTQAYWDGFRTKCAEMGVDAVKLAQSALENDAWGALGAGADVGALVAKHPVLSGAASGGMLGLAGGLAASPFAAAASAIRRSREERAKGAAGKPKRAALVAALKELLVTPLQGAAIGGTIGTGLGALAHQRLRG